MNTMETTVTATGTTIVLTGALAGDVSGLAGGFVAATAAAVGTLTVDITGITTLGIDGLGLVMSSMRACGVEVVIVAAGRFVGTMHLVTRRTATTVKIKADYENGCTIATTRTLPPAATVVDATSMVRRRAARVGTRGRRGAVAVAL